MQCLSSSVFPNISCKALCHVMLSSVDAVLATKMDDLTKCRHLYDVSSACLWWQAVSVLNNYYVRNIMRLQVCTSSLHCHLHFALVVRLTCLQQQFAARSVHNGPVWRSQNSKAVSMNTFLESHHHAGACNGLGGRCTRTRPVETSADVAILTSTKQQARTSHGWGFSH